jgi:hypothetical protein
VTVKFNLYFKELCFLAGMSELVEGALINPETKRKEEGVFPKYKLVSSHICEINLLLLISMANFPI